MTPTFPLSVLSFLGLAIALLAIAESEANIVYHEAFPMKGRHYIMLKQQCVGELVVLSNEHSPFEIDAHMRLAYQEQQAPLKAHVTFHIAPNGVIENLAFQIATQGVQLQGVSHSMVTAPLSMHGHFFDTPIDTSSSVFKKVMLESTNKQGRSLTSELSNYPLERIAQLNIAKVMRAIHFSANESECTDSVDLDPLIEKIGLPFYDIS